MPNRKFSVLSLAALLLLGSIPALAAPKQKPLPPLFAAIERGDLKKVQLLSKNKKALAAETEFEDERCSGCSPLRFAALRGRAPIVAALLDAGATDPSTCASAAQSGSAETVRLLLERKLSCDENALSWAARGGNVELLRALLDAGVRPGPKAEHPLTGAVIADKPDCVRLLLEAGLDANPRLSYGYEIGAGTPLMLAALLGSAEAGQLLIPKSDLKLTDSKGWTALHYAVSSKADAGLAIAQALLAAGAAPDGRGKAGETPLMLAFGKPALLKMLVAAGADPKAVSSNGWSVLHYAAGNCALTAETAAAMREIGVDANAALADGEDAGATALHLYLLRGCQAQPATIGLLIDAGVKPNAADKKGRTALSLAAGRGLAPVVELLLSRGADPKQGASPLRAALTCSYDSSHFGTYVRDCHGELALKLLEAGAPVDPGTDGERRTLLHVAVESGKPELLARLLDRLAEHGADFVNRPDKRQRTPLHYAAYRCQVPMVEMLLAKGADRQLLDKDEKTAADLTGNCAMDSPIHGLLRAAAAGE